MLALPPDGCPRGGANDSSAVVVAVEAHRAAKSLTFRGFLGGGGPMLSGFGLLIFRFSSFFHTVHFHLSGEGKRRLVSQFLDFDVTVNRMGSPQDTAKNGSLQDVAKKGSPQDMAKKGSHQNMDRNGVTSGCR